MIFIALGSNRSGAWGSPQAALKRAVAELATMPGTAVLRHSSLYNTAGVGPGRPGVFVNSVAAVECHCSPESLLRRLKWLERRAGPRSARRWGPRTLDLDILDFRGRVVGWPERGGPSDAAIRHTLVLPHPQMHLRPFVLAPLAQIAPGWRHPVLQRSARQLRDRMRNEPAGRVLSPL